MSVRGGWVCVCVCVCGGGGEGAKGGSCPLPCIIPHWAVRELLLCGLCLCGVALRAHQLQTSPGISLHMLMQYPLFPPTLPSLYSIPFHLFSPLFLIFFFYKADASESLRSGALDSFRLACVGNWVSPDSPTPPLHPIFFPL